MAVEVDASAAAHMANTERKRKRSMSLRTPKIFFYSTTPDHRVTQTPRQAIHAWVRPARYELLPLGLLGQPVLGCLQVALDLGDFRRFQFRRSSRVPVLQ